jgi:uroporphyrinogen decarboxylase
MNARERLLAALSGKPADRLPATTHELMPYFLNRYMHGATHQQFFDRFGLDPILWTAHYRPDPSQGEYFDPHHQPAGPLEGRRIASDQWRVEAEEVPGQEYRTTRYRFVTPGGTLTMVLQSNDYTSWVTERPIQRKEDIELIAAYATAPKCDVEAVNRAAEQFGERGIVRGIICGFDVYGQAGCWQDAACLFGIENLILATYDDPQWVHEFLSILQRRKEVFVRSLKGARYDLIEMGGGDASSTVISPRILDEFVAPYDSKLIALAHEAGQRVVYHTCGGMMPILERIADMGPDAMETFTPPGMGGDTDLREAKRRIGRRVCMIGGFDQFHFFQGCTPEETRAEVRRCFEEAGPGGGYILSPSDHFFDADLSLIEAFADEARRCTYG